MSHKRIVGHSVFLCLDCSKRFICFAVRDPQTVRDQLSQDLGLPKSFISEMENSKKPVTIQIIDRYAEYFKVPAWQIVFLGKVYDSKSQQSRLAKMLVALLEWISNSESPADLRLPVKRSKAVHPQRRASDSSPKRRIDDFIGAA